jgi:hypothetical protein
MGLPACESAAITACFSLCQVTLPNDFIKPQVDLKA